MLAAPPTDPAPKPASSRGDSDLLAAAARLIRRSGRNALAQYVLLGVAGGVGAVVGGAALWPFLVPFVVTGAAGAWGLADQELVKERRGRRRRRVLALCTAARNGAALLGVASALFMVAVVLSGLFGRVIS